MYRDRRATALAFLVIVPLVIATALAITTPWGWLLFPAAGLLAVLVYFLRRQR